MPRMRKTESGTTKRKSWYTTKNWIYNEKGERSGASFTHSSNIDKADLISSTIYNPSKDTETVYCLPMDLDAHRAEDCWKDEEGRLDWGEIGNFLFSTYPFLQSKIPFVMRSTGGKGLALMLAITPMELTDSTFSNQQLAKTVQMQFLLLLNHHGMGADPAALGLKRDFANWKNEGKVIDGDYLLLRRIDKERPPILSELSDQFNKLPFCSNYKHKKGDESYIYPDKRAEGKLSQLYLALLEALLFEEEASKQLSIKEIRLITGLSEKTIAKVLKNGLHWLEAEYLDQKEGWKLTITPDIELTARAELLTNKKESKSSQKKISTVTELKPPEKVEDGERNEWIASLCLILKHTGVNRSAALNLLNRQVLRIEGNRFSRNCRNASRILLNIYNNKPESFGCKEDFLLFNGWLKEALDPLSNKGSKGSVQNYRRGVAPVADCGFLESVV